MDTTQCNLPNCNNTDIVESGVDALVYGGIPTGWYCHSCARTFALIKNHITLIHEGANN